MRKRLSPLLLLVIAAGLLMAGCAAPVASQPATSTPEPLASPTQAASAAPSPTSAATLAPTVAPAATETPAALSGKIATYRDDFAGIEMDYPDGWTVIDVTPEIKKQSLAYSVSFMSWKPVAGGGEGFPQGGTKLDLTVRLDKGGAFPEVLAERKQELASSPEPTSILAEEQWTLANGAQAVRWQLTDPRTGQFAEVVTSLNGKMVVLNEYGDLRLADQIARTLRIASGPAAKATLPSDAAWVFVNGRVVALAPGQPSVSLREPGQQAFSGPGQSTVTPDGSALIYFKVSTNPPNQQMMVLNTRTGETRLLAEAATLWSPRLSPDGRMVAYTIIDSQNYENAKWELTVRDLAGGAPRVIMSGDRTSSQGTLTPLAPVQWTADGLLVEKIIWASDAPPQGLYRVINGAPKAIYDKSYVHAVVSPDGTRAILIQGQIQMGESQPKLALNLLDLASGQVKPLVPETPILLTSLRWSPDSSKILYTIQDSATAPVELRVMSADGSNVQKLAFQVQNALRDVTWQDNRTLLFLFVDMLNTLHVSRAPVDNLTLQSLTEIGRVPGSDPQNPGDQFIYVPR